MHAILKISESTQNTPDPSAHYMKAQLQITNASPSYIHNLKLIVNTKETSILPQCIIRQRGTLCFETPLEEVDVGNLAPDETAYFEYAFKPQEDSSSLSSHILVEYTAENSTDVIYEKINDLLTSE